VTVFLNEAVSGPLLRCFDDNGAIAVPFSRPMDHRTVQLKGKVVERRPCGPEEARAQERYVGGFAEQVYVVGLPRSISRRLRLHPGVAVTFEIEALYDQTPGPDAGRALVEEAEG